MTGKTRRTRAKRLIRDLMGDGAITPAEVHRALERSGLAPSRSVTYGWCREVADEMARDGSGPWTLPADETRRPDIVLAVLGARYRRYVEQRGALPDKPLPVSAEQARMCVRLATAAPGFVPPPTDDPATVDAKLLDLWGWALAYVGADTDTIREHDAQIARFMAAGAPRIDGDRQLWAAWTLTSAASGAYSHDEPMDEAVR